MLFFLFQIKNSSIPTFFTNRALCYLKLKQWELAAQDCKRALEMDSNVVKGHFFYGQAVLELNYYDDAIKSLTRGMKVHSISMYTSSLYGRCLTSVSFQICNLYAWYRHGRPSRYICIDLIFIRS